jgi:DNA mismatch endonuclease (patch repair protein)
MDTVSIKQRSQIMRLVKSKDTKLEIGFIRAFRKLGCKFRRNVSDYFGKPDIVLLKFKTVIFIDSCFWHGCAKHCRMPSTRRTYWVSKIEKNKIRDKEVKKHYKKLGWKIIRIWEHNLQDEVKATFFIKKSLNIK